MAKADNNDKINKIILIIASFYLVMQLFAW